MALILHRARRKSAALAGVRELSNESHKRSKSTDRSRNHKFPSAASELLDLPRGLYDDWDGDMPKTLIVHCYYFVNGELEADAASYRVAVLKLCNNLA